MESFDFVNQVVALINLERSQLGLPPVTVDSQLSRAAQNHSVDMALNDYFSHNELNGSTVSTRVEAAGYDWLTCGENIGAGCPTPEEVVQAWMNSPGHRANILNPDFQNIGIGYKFLENDTGSFNYHSYWTQVFGTRNPNGANVLGIDSDETLQGGQGNDTILAYEGDDVVFGNGGDDTLCGNQGNDTLYGNQGNDILYGGKDNDIIFGGKDKDILLGNLGNDILYGNLGNDTLYGGKEDDLLYGGKDDDIVLGDLGNDTLSGDLGFDTLTGGGGSDTFVLQVGKGTDVITDFQGGIDLIALGSGLIFADLTIVQGTDNNAANTLITSNGAALAVLIAIQASTITNSNFGLI